MDKLVIHPAGLIIFVIRCILAFSLTIFWFIPSIREIHDQDGWLTFWYLVALILIVSFRITFRTKENRYGS